MYPSLYPFGTGGDCIKYIRTYLNWEPDDLATAERLVAKNIIPLKTGTELAVYLGISRKLIGAIALRPHKYYRAFEITKANGKKRTIHAPRVFLKTIQRYILDCVLTSIKIRRRLPLRKSASSALPLGYLTTIQQKAENIAKLLTAFPTKSIDLTAIKSQS